MHELSHIILGHELAEACILEDGSLVPGNFNQEQENEADWLAGTLLLPRPALLLVQSRRMTNLAASDHYMVSHEMLTWRTRMTGVAHQMQRRRRG
jgi:Zn-dependent peptidase ImmA (M78 family)